MIVNFQQSFQICLLFFLLTLNMSRNKRIYFPADTYLFKITNKNSNILEEFKVRNAEIRTTSIDLLLFAT